MFVPYQANPLTRFRSLQGTAKPRPGHPERGFFSVQSRKGHAVIVLLKNVSKDYAVSSVILVPLPNLTRISRVRLPNIQWDMGSCDGD